MDIRKYSKKDLKDFYFNIYDAVNENKKSNVDALLEKCPELFELPYYTKPKSDWDKNVISKLVDIYDVSPEMICYCMDKGADFNNLDERLQVPAFCYAIINSSHVNLPVEMAKHMTYFRTDSFLNNPYFYAILTKNIELVSILTEKEIDLTVSYEYPLFDKIHNVLSFAALFNLFFKGSKWQDIFDEMYKKIEEASNKQGVVIPDGFVSNEVRNRPLTDGDKWFFKKVVDLGIWCDNIAIITYFSKNCRNVLNEIIDRNGTTLHYACENGIVEIIKAMIEAGADPLLFVKTSYNDIRLPAVGIAIANSNVEVALYLLKKYPKAVLLDQKGDLLQIAITHSDAEVTCELVKALVEAGAKVDVYYEYKGWQTSFNPISLAKSENKTDVADYLMKIANEQGIVLEDYKLREPDKEQMDTYRRYVEYYNGLKKENSLVVKSEKRLKLKSKYASFYLYLRAAIRTALEHASKNYSSETAYQFTLAFLYEGEYSNFWTVLSTEEEYEKKDIDQSYRYYIEECGRWNQAEDVFNLLNQSMKKLPYDRDDFMDNVQEMALQCLEDVRAEGLLEANNFDKILLNYYVREYYEPEKEMQMAERLNPGVEELMKYKQSMELLY